MWTERWSPEGLHVYNLKDNIGLMTLSRREVMTTQMIDPKYQSRCNVKDIYKILFQLYACAMCYIKLDIICI